MKIYLRRGVIVDSQAPLDGSFARIYVEGVLEKEIVVMSLYWVKGQVQPTEWSFQPIELLPINNSKKIRFLKTGQQKLFSLPRKATQITFL